jgi:hypothetical protein
MICTTIKKKDTKQAINSYLIASELALSRAPLLLSKSIGVLIGIGVPYASGNTYFIYLPVPGVFKE